MFTTLSLAEFDECVQLALKRQQSAVEKKLKDSVRKQRDWVDSLSGHIKGVIGEMAVAKALGIPYSGTLDTFRTVADVGRYLEVRHRSNPAWDLIIRDDDSDSKIYILSRGLPPGAIEIAGWTLGKDAKQKRWLDTKGGLRPAYFVPAEFLQPMDGLPNG